MPPAGEGNLDKRGNADEGLMDDLERLNSALESLRNETSRKDDLLRIAAHDLLSPANSISGLAKLLLKPETASNLTDRQLRIIQTMDKAMDQYLRALNNISELSRIFRNKVSLKPKRQNGPALAARCMDKIRPLAAGKGITLAVGPMDDGDIVADEEMAEKTIMRLLENAVMFTNPGGTVEVAMRADGSLMALEVRDNGVGVEKERLGRLFDICECNNTFGTCGEKGSGLGLCIAQRIARLGGGDLTIESTPGRGTVARITFPAEK
jgi:signal transduction histidine kinase